MKRFFLILCLLSLNSSSHLPRSNFEKLSPKSSHPFFGTTYLSVFINSDGNLTFGQGDNASMDRSLSRFNGGPPRIGGFFADLDPTAGRGGVFYNALPDRFVVTWDRVREFNGIAESSFQVTLFAEGATARHSG